MAVKFSPASKEKTVEVFKSPTGTKGPDQELVNYIKTMAIGDAIELPKDPVLTDRSLKVQVGKAAKLAGKKIDWADVDGGFMARVIANIEVNGTSQNGTVQTTTTVEEVVAAPAEQPTEEATTSGRNRR